MPPAPRQVPIFAAEPPQEPLPYGRWGEALGEHFARAAETGIGEIAWFPDRTWAGRTYVPATAPAEDGGEVFGYVSYTREHEGAQAIDFAAAADFTDETPPRTRTGRSTSRTTRSGTGAGRRAGAA